MSTYSSKCEQEVPQTEVCTKFNLPLWGGGGKNMLDKRNLTNTDDVWQPSQPSPSCAHSLHSEVAGFGVAAPACASEGTAPTLKEFLLLVTWPSQHFTSSLQDRLRSPHLYTSVPTFFSILLHLYSSSSPPYVSQPTKQRPVLFGLSHAYHPPKPASICHTRSLAPRGATSPRLCQPAHP